MHRIWLFFRYGLVIIGFMLTAITLSCFVRRVISVEEVKKMINDQVPVGSDKQQVKVFMENLKIDSLRIGRDDFRHADPESLGNRDPEKIAELGDRIAEFAGVVIYHAQRDGILTFDNIVIQFYIDKEGLLIGYTVKMVGAD